MSMCVGVVSDADNIVAAVQMLQELKQKADLTEEEWKDLFVQYMKVGDSKRHIVIKQGFCVRFTETRQDLLLGMMKKRSHRIAQRLETCLQQKYFQ